MDLEFWNQRWQSGRIGFHSSEVHWALIEHWAQLTLPADAPVLVPLCGKTLDMRWLRECGHPVTGVELSAIAVAEFFSEWRLKPRHRSAVLPGLELYQANGVSLWQGDFFGFCPEQTFSAFYDRAALIALPSDLRPAYLSHLRSRLQDGAVGLLVTLEYDQTQIDGPPFSVPVEEVMTISGFTAKVLERRNVLAASPRFLNQGVSALHETVYRLIAS